MSYDSIRIALYSHLQDNITDVPIRFETIKEEDNVVSDGLLWIRCTNRPNFTSQRNLGVSNPLDRTIGILVIDIYDTKEHGMADMLRTADRIKNLYMGKTFNNGSLVINSIRILNQGSDNNWNGISVYCGYIENIRRE